MKTTRCGDPIPNVNEYTEGYPVHVYTLAAGECVARGKSLCVLSEPREVIEAITEGGYNATLIDLVDLVTWIRAHRPELLR